jgi:hypothetical protein
VPYLIAAVILILLLIGIFRLLLYILHEIVLGVTSALDGIGHGLVAAARFLVMAVPEIFEAVAAAGLLWVACWLVSETWYYWRDSRADQRWFEAIGPRIAVAMGSGGSRNVALLAVPPRPTAFGQGKEHPLTVPIPSVLQGLVDMLTHPSKLGVELPAVTHGSGVPAGRPSVLSPGARQEPRGAAHRKIPERLQAEAVENLNWLPVIAQLSRMRDLVDAGAYMSASVLVIAEEPASPGLAPGITREVRGTRDAPGAAFWASRPGRAAEDWLAKRQAEPAEICEQGRVVVRNSDGTQVGVDNKQYNFYTWEVATPRISSLAERLEDPDVAEVVGRLAHDPQDRKARRELLHRIAPGGLRLGGPTSMLRVSVLNARTTRSGSWLDGTVFFRDVSHGQIGDRNTQRNEFVYAVTPTASARELLADNPRLAKVLIDCAFPPRDQPDLTKLGREFRSVLEAAPLEPSDGRECSVHYEFPRPGTTLEIWAHDGVSVGSRSAISRTDRVTAEPTRERFPLSAVDRILDEYRAIARIDDRPALHDHDTTRATHGVDRPAPGIGSLF